MIHEFAVDPEIGADWKDLRFIVSHCGVEHGRMISQFPSKWERLVYDHAGATPIQRKRIEEILAGVRRKLVKAGRPFDPDLPWTDNAMRSHRQAPFQAIVSANPPRPGAPFLAVDDLSDHDPCWNLGRGATVARSPEAMASAAANFLRWSSQIRFIDQHFSCESRHVRPLVEFLKVSRTGSGRHKTFEYHLSAKGTSSWFYSTLREKIMPKLSLRGDEQITFVRWKRLDFGENQHARYLLSDLGGLRFEVGLDCGDKGETTDVETLEPKIYAERWAQTAPDSRAFELVDAWIVGQGTVTSTRRGGPQFSESRPSIS